MGRIVAINVYPCCAKMSKVTPIFVAFLKCSKHNYQLDQVLENFEYSFYFNGIISSGQIFFSKKPLAVCQQRLLDSGTKSTQGGTVGEKNKVGKFIHKLMALLSSNESLITAFDLAVTYNTFSLF